MASLNSSFHRAMANKEDEFYTQIEDIEKELIHYKSHFLGKTIFLNCDDPEYSNFWKYFQLKFYEFGLKKLISTHYCESGISYKMEIVSNEKNIADSKQIQLPDYVKTSLKENGDFRNEECIDLLDEADIIVTNPPFSLFREYVSLLIEKKKKFIIIGNQNAVSTKEFFPLIKENKLWMGYKCGDMAFKVPDYYEPRATRFWIDENGQKWRSLGNICWYTNLDIPKRHERFIPVFRYDPKKYPKFDNYDAINVDKVVDIPMDYEGVMGVPVTFLDKYNPDQFRIIGHTHSADISPEVEKLRTSTKNRHRGMINGQQKYERILIQWK